MRSYGWAAGLLLFLFGSTSLEAEVADQTSDTAQTAPPVDPGPTAQPVDASSGEATS